MFKQGYMKEGKGVEKRNPDDLRIKIFFELLFRKLGRLVQLNLLYIVCCIPTFLVMMFLSGLISTRITDASASILAEIMGLAAPDGSNPEFSGMLATLDIGVRVVISFVVAIMWGMGPVTAGFTYILRNYAREEHAWILSDFFGKTKQNFVQALVVWLADLFVFAVLTTAFFFYSSQSGMLYYLSFVVLSVVILYTVMHFYMYQCMITFKLSIKDVFKNSAIFALVEAPKNLLLAFILLFVHLGLPYMAALYGWPMWFWLIFIVLELLILVAASGFTVNFWVYPALEKYIIEAEKKFDETKSSDSTDKKDDVEYLM